MRRNLFYACHFRFNVLGAIKFGRRVTSVRPRTKGSGWDVETRDVRSGTISSSTFDAVMVCNGHYSVPHCAPINNIGSFEGTVMHSHDYRLPEMFKGETGECGGVLEFKKLHCTLSIYLELDATALTLLIRSTGGPVWCVQFWS